VRALRIQFANRSLVFPVDTKNSHRSFVGVGIRDLKLSVSPKIAAAASTVANREAESRLE